MLGIWNEKFNTYVFLQETNGTTNLANKLTHNIYNTDDNSDEAKRDNMDKEKYGILYRPTPKTNSFDVFQIEPIKNDLNCSITKSHDTDSDIFVMNDTLNSKDINAACVNNTMNNNVTPDEHVVPKKIMNLSSPDKYTEILPLGSKNVSSNTITVTFKGCTLLKGTFVIDEHVNNVCLIVFKYVKYLKEKMPLLFMAYLDTTITTVRNLKFILQLKPISSSLIYCQKSYLTSQVRGIERTIVKKQIIDNKPFNIKKKALLRGNINVMNKVKNLKFENWMKFEFETHQVEL